MKNRLLGLVFLLSGLSWIFLWSPLSSRWQREEQTSLQDVVVDGNEIFRFIEEQGEGPEAALRLLAQNGVTAVALHEIILKKPLWEVPGGISHRQAEQVRESGLKPFLYLEQHADDSPAKLARLLEQYRRDLGPSLTLIWPSQWLPASEPALDSIAKTLSREMIRYAFFEFERYPNARQLAVSAPGQVVRSHTITPQELRQMNQQTQWSRWRRAVRERQIALLFVHLPENQSLERFGKGLQQILYEIRSGSLRHSEVLLPGCNPRAIQMRQLAALALALLVPMLCLMILQVKSLPRALQFLGVIYFTFWGAISMAGLLSLEVFRQQIYAFTGVKAAMVLPLLMAIPMIFGRGQIQRWLERPIQIKVFVYLLAVAGLLGFLILRSGNAGAAFSNDFERLLRDRLEGWLAVRPRFKEILIGYPALLFALILPHRNALKRGAILLSLFVPISVLGTFAHAHTPLAISLLRTLNGAMIGLCVGGVFYIVFVKLRRKIQ